MVQYHYHVASVIDADATESIPGIDGCHLNLKLDSRVFFGPATGSSAE